MKQTLIVLTITAFISFGGLGLEAHAANSFKDISEDFWGYEDISNLIEQGIINGFPNDTYRPNESLTRAQSAMIIGRTLEANVHQQNEHHFSDVSAETSGSDYIHALTNEGIFAKSDHFHPQNPLTRAQMAKILVLAFDLNGSSNKTFDDVGTDHWAADYIYTLVATGITTGTSETTYSPNDSINRGQMAVFINRTLEYLEEQSTGGGLEIDDIIIE